MLDLGTSALLLAIAVGAVDIVLLAAALGGFRALIAHPPALSLLAIWAAAGIYGAIALPREAPKPVRRASEPAVVVLALALLPFVTLFASAWSQRRNLAPLAGDGPLAWAGVALVATGTLLRAAAVTHLGHAFTPSILVQEDQTLRETGPYAHMRHPGYAGALINGLGTALAFQSGLGLLLALAMLIPMRVRIRTEERLMAEHFGPAYESYRRRTGGLWPIPWRRRA